MIIIKPAKIFTKFTIPPYLRLQVARLFVMLVVFLVLPVISQLQLLHTQPSVREGAIIEVEPPSRSPSFLVKLSPPAKIPATNARDIVLYVNEADPKVEVGSKQLASLCNGITDPWTLVPNPGIEGQYIICNSSEGKMATVDELNTAQNNYRVSRGLNSLSINNDLCKIAGERAIEVASNFSHDGFESAVDRSGIQKSSVGENIASGPLTAVQFVEWSWNKSPGHRANMLGDWSEGCAGVHDRFAVFIFAK